MRATLSKCAKNFIRYLYFHGNAGNICDRLPDLMLINSFGINVLGISYRGYGKSRGKPSEEGIYKDGRAALNHATHALGFPTRDIIIMGRSIGTTVAVELAQDSQIGGVILITPITSGKDAAKAIGLGFFSFLAGDAFNNIGKTAGIQCPALVIHGTRDEVLPFAMGKRLFENIKSKKQFVQIDGAGHNDLSIGFKTQYWPPIKKFIQSLDNSP